MSKVKVLEAAELYKEFIRAKRIMEMWQEKLNRQMDKLSAEDLEEFYRITEGR